MASQTLTFIDADTDLDALLPIAPVGRASWAKLDGDERAEALTALSPYFSSFQRSERRFYGADWHKDLASSDLAWAECLYEYATLGTGATFEEVLASPADAAQSAAYYMDISNVVYDDGEPV